MILALALAASVAAAQAKPDFSGRWTTEAEVTSIPPAAPGGGRGAPPSPGQRGMGSGWGPTITITQDAERLTVEYAFFSRGDMQPPLRFTYALDGSPTKNSVMMGRGIQVQTSTTAWTGDRLTITTVHSLTDPATGKAVTTSVTQTLSLASPTSLVVETTRRGVFGGPDTTSKTTYRKL